VFEKCRHLRRRTLNGALENLLVWALRRNTDTEIRLRRLYLDERSLHVGYIRTNKRIFNFINIKKEVVMRSRESAPQR